jgi:DNA-directed RNA polymerase subunit A"
MANRIKAALVRGVKGVNRAVVVRGEDGDYFVRASGFNIIGACAYPGVDTTRIYTNNIKEIERIYGVEAARNAIIKETKDVMEMQKLYVDIRHITLIADAMTFDGAIRSIGRHGLSGEKIGILGRAAFEETVKHLINASSTAEEDNLLGVTENIIVGQTVPVGTGRIKLVMKKIK